MDANNDPAKKPKANDHGASSFGTSQWDTQFQKIKDLLMDDKETVLTFETLYIKESEDLGKPVNKEKVRVCTSTGGEPWVNFTPQDRFGLALSGGGIRSATFNLGLLQSLDQLGVLKHLDYLATVSGGGYVGGFWTAWLRRNSPENANGKFFPTADDSTGSESAEVRHLREFSRFLLPRFSLIGTEFWSIAMTWLGGAIPSLASGAAVLLLMWFIWVFALGCLHAGSDNRWHVGVMLGLVCLEFIRSEIPWKKPTNSEVNKNSESLWNLYNNEHDRLDIAGYLIGAIVGTSLIAITWISWRTFLPHTPDMTSLKSVLSVRLSGFAALQRPAVGFRPALLIGTVTLILLIMRATFATFFITKNRVSFLVGFERAATRMLRLAIFTLVLAVFWWLAGQILASKDKCAPQAMGAGAAISAGLFLKVRKWLSEPPQETHGGDVLKMVYAWLRHATPRVLATITWVLLFILAGSLWIYWLKAYGTPSDPAFWILPGTCMLLVVLMIAAFDPGRMGMHELYRSRISRCYLGASNEELNAVSAAAVREVRKRSKNQHLVDLSENSKVTFTPAMRAERNRQTKEHPLDDILTLADLTWLNRPRTAPLHLICTTANDLSGDALGTLYRGGKSAVFSAHGISLGDQTAKLDLRFSSALTASAAAFNSQMGRYSVNLGPAVTFLMAAFNLRLGLWVPHPTNNLRWRARFPGRFFFRELLGKSRATAGQLFISDGGHFENFGLYELIRRHCRYIIVSDCGSDPESAFDDLANVIRRVREDFGVEVELDVRPLDSDGIGLSRQHAVVGTIHYNGLGGMDKGTILFIKPVMTGDEPPDVLQYKTRNRDFPQESTANQFYDEPQWESYRRLGEHTGRTVLEFLDPPDADRPDTVDNMFREVRSFWNTLPDNLGSQFTELSSRCSELEQNLTTQGPLLLRLEFLPEVAEMAKPSKPPATKSGAAESAAPAPDVAVELDVLGFLLQVLQLMEDVWLSVNLERYWSHPLNEGWMNYFHRWAGTPSFRRWWPVLAPVYSAGFRAFVLEHFAIQNVDCQTIPSGSPEPRAARLCLSSLKGTQDYRDSNAWQSFLQHRPGVQSTLGGREILGYALRLMDRTGVPAGPDLWVGFLIARESHGTTRKEVEWSSEDFFVPPMLHGGKFVSNLLDAVIRYYKMQAPIRLVVKLQRTSETELAGSSKGLQAKKSQGLAPAARYDRVREIEFYKSREFQYEQPEDPETGAISLHLDLHSK